MTAGTPLAGRGIREKLLRLIGAGDLYDLLREARSECDATIRRLQTLEFENRRLIENVTDAPSAPSMNSDERYQYERLAWMVADFEDRRANNQIIELEYPANTKVRHGWGKPDQASLRNIIGDSRDRYISRLRSFTGFIDKAREIQRIAEDVTKPQWRNDWFPPFDAMSLYGFLVERAPPKLVEIGSGTSTKFARQAILDHGLSTKIISIDPQPRSEIDAICDVIVRSPLEDAPRDEFQSLTSSDMVFFDGSHRSFQNSDVTVFFTEILPALPSGILVGIHDIFLPADYPPEWAKRFYSEQYLLACWLLAGDRLQVELPVWYCSSDPELNSILDRLWKSPNLVDCNIAGGAFWFTVK